jgi:hypothetical protein
MDGDPEYRRLQFTIADLLAVMALVAVVGSLSTLPISPFHAIPMFAVLYVVKFRILTFRVQPWIALLLFFLVVVALLPYLYCRVTDVRYIFVGRSRVPEWIGLPLVAFAVPTTFFVRDVLGHKQLSLGFYILRSLVEIVLLIPLLFCTGVSLVLW